MVKIEDVIVPSKGTGKYFAIKCLQINITKDSSASPTFYWEVKTETDASPMDDTQEKVPGVTILDGNLTMTTEEYSQWTTDDTYVIDWALEKLGFKEISKI